MIYVFRPYGCDCSACDYDFDYVCRLLPLLQEAVIY